MVRFRFFLDSSCNHDAKSNRNSILLKQINTIYEIMRVLGLTTFDETEWAMDDVTVMNKALNLIVEIMDLVRTSITSNISTMQCFRLLFDSLEIDCVVIVFFSVICVLCA